ncbi:hypothetical protein KJ564_09870 [bacterium]|nr:hypothetical protein [bacterium]
MTIAILAASSLEFSTFKGCMGAVEKDTMGDVKYYIWTQNGHQIILLETGIGPEKASVALSGLLSKHQVDCLVNFGSAGMLDQKLELKQTFLVDEVIDAHTGRMRTTNPQINDALSRFLAESAKPFAKGRLVTSAEPVCSKPMRTKLADRYSGEAVDMEAFVLAEIAQQSKIPFASIKMISDRANTNTRLQYFINLPYVNRKLGKLMYGFLEYLHAT